MDFLDQIISDQEDESLSDGSIEISKEELQTILEIKGNPITSVYLFIKIEQKNKIKKVKNKHFVQGPPVSQVKVEKYILNDNY